MADLVLINGIPGTGKSTLAAKLTMDLNIPCMGKDMLKEFFFDTLGVDGRESSRMLGRTAFRTLYMLAEDYLSAGRSLMLEGALFAEFARVEFQKILDKYPANVIEVYCRTDPKVRRERFRMRYETGERHQGHQDGIDLALSRDTDPEPVDAYAPLGIGTLIEVDTTQFGDEEYENLVRQLKVCLEKK